MSQGDASGRGRVPVKVKKDRGRTASSRAWLKRQLNDPYVAAAKAKGYRSRAAFKLLELDEKFHLLKKGAKVLDLGAAMSVRTTSAGPSSACFNIAGTSASVRSA